MTIPTVVGFLLDRSSSMSSILETTIEAFNGYRDALAAETEADILFNLVTFSTTGLDVVCRALPIAQAPHLSRENYMPMGSTPLIDSAISMIEAVERQVAERTAKVIICIQTDGEENCSIQPWSKLKALIAAKTELGWSFNFMGAGIDAYQQAAKMGVAAGQTMSYDARDVKATRAAFTASAANAADFSAGRRTDTAYSAAQRNAAGDRHVPAYFRADLAPQPQPTTAAPPAAVRSVLDLTTASQRVERVPVGEKLVL